MSAESVDPLVRLASLRIRVMRAHEQAKLLRADLPPMFHEEIDQVTGQLAGVYLQLTDIIEVVAPNGINDTEEDLKREQKRLASVMKQLQKGDALRGIVDVDDFYHD